jgi:hypothetical protein
MYFELSAKTFSAFLPSIYEYLFISQHFVSENIEDEISLLRVLLGL